MEDQVYTKNQLFSELKEVTNNFTTSEDTIRVGYEDEKDHIIEILSENNYEFNVDKDGEWFEIKFWKEKIKENMRLQERWHHWYRLYIVLGDTEDDDYEEPIGADEFENIPEEYYDVNSESEAIDKAKKLHKFIEENNLKDLEDFKYVQVVEIMDDEERGSETEVIYETYEESSMNEGYSREGYSWDEINGMIHIYEDGKLIDKYPDMESAEEAGWDLEVLNESLDQMREKALKMKEDSTAFAILYGYKVKDKEVELEPEEYSTEKEYKDRIQQITNSFTKLSDKDPRGNRYGKEHNITFYTVYPNKKQPMTETIEKWNIGSDKSKLTQEELDLLERLAQKLEVNSPNGYKYVVQSTYEDYGSGMKWWNIICYNKKGYSWQVLNTKEWLDLMNTGDVDSVYQSVVNDKYFQDKQKEINEMSMWEMFESIKED